MTFVCMFYTLRVELLFIFVYSVALNNVENGLRLDAILLS